MPTQKIIQAFRNYQKAGVNIRLTYLNNFEKKMIYRTTKTENPETTPKMVKDILHKLKKT